jgi:prophage regulatory protein
MVRLRAQFVVENRMVHAFSGPKVIGADAFFAIYASNMQRPSHPPSEPRDTARVGTDAPLLFASLPTVMQTTGLGRSTIYRLMTDGAFPAPVRLGPRAVGWRWSDLDRWSELRQGDSFAWHPGAARRVKGGRSPAPTNP